MSDLCQVRFDPNSLEDYRLFLRVKSLPRCRLWGKNAEFPAEYAAGLGLAPAPALALDYTPLPSLFDYQRDISRLCIRKQKFAVFADCGLGKSLILLEFARHATSVLPGSRKVLIVSPLMVIPQTMAECLRFYGGLLRLEQVRAVDLAGWTEDDTSGIGITNYEAITDRVRQGNIGCLILDDAAPFKSHYGKWARRLIDLGRGLDWKLCLTGTPAPNDRIEYANYSVFLDQFPTVNSFLARYFVNRGETGERWELKPHALRPFYQGLSHWCIFLTNPATYGWEDNCGTIPPIEVTIHDVPLTDIQQGVVSGISKNLFGLPGGITSRSKLSQLAKGRVAGKDVETLKPAFIRDLVASWPDESTLIWCRYDAEQNTIEAALPDAASIRGKTPDAKRQQIISDFQAGKIKTLISKPEVLGFGLNLQVCTRQVFSGLEDSYEKYYQCVKRSNRVGSTRPLNVHIPVTEIERSMIETVLAKARRVQADTEEQERLFKEIGHVTF